MEKHGIQSGRNNNYTALKNNTNIVTQLAQIRKNQTYTLPKKYLNNDYLLLFVLDTPTNTSTVVRHIMGPVIGSGYAGGGNMELTSGSYYSSDYYQTIVISVSSSKVVSIRNAFINGVDYSGSAILYIVAIQLR